MQFFLTYVDDITNVFVFAVVQPLALELDVPLLQV